MIKYKYKSQPKFQYTENLPLNVLKINRNTHFELIRLPDFFNSLETKKLRKPPLDYICFRCGRPSHFIQDCPTNENELFEIKIHKPTGIPKEFLEVQQSNSKNIMITSKGEVVQSSARTEEWNQICPKKVFVPKEFLCEVCEISMFLPHKVISTDDSDLVGTVCLECIPKLIYQKGCTKYKILFDEELTKKINKN